LCRVKPVAECFPQIDSTIRDRISLESAFALLGDSIPFAGFDTNILKYL
jgi:hypothetical protein